MIFEGTQLAGTRDAEMSTPADAHDPEWWFSQTPFSPSFVSVFVVIPEIPDTDCKTWGYKTFYSVVLCGCHAVCSG